MSCLLIVRHGQASAGTDDYDRLSDLGKYQARILGEHWAARGLVLDRVIAGTHRRHRETAEHAGRAFVDAGGVWPEPEALSEFDEHSGFEIVIEALEQLPDRDPRIGAWARALGSGPDGDRELFWEAFRYITRLWAIDQLPLEGTRRESWRAFRSRVESGLDVLAEGTERGRNVAVFTSAGPSGAAAAAALELADGPAMELSWSVQNSAVTELFKGSGGLRLRSFNSASHLPSADLVTLV